MSARQTEPERLGLPAWLVVAMGAGLLLRVAIFLAWVGTPEPWEFEEIARNIVAGKGYLYFDGRVEYRTYGAPLYVYLTAALYRLFAFQPLPVILMQGVFTAGVAYVVGRIAKDLFSPAVGAGAALLTMFHPAILYYDTHKLHSLSLDSLSLVFVLYVFLFFRREVVDRVRQGHYGRVVLVGLGVGLALWERTTAAPFAVAMAVGWSIRESRRGALWPCLGGLGLVGIGTALAFAPWIVRNYLLYDAFVATLLTQGFLFWKGNGAPAWWARFPEIVHLGEYERNAALLDAARSYVLAHPGEYLLATLSRIYHFFWFRPEAGELYPAPYLRLYQSIYVGYLLLAAAGLASVLLRCRRSLRSAGVLLGFLLTVAAAHALFYVNTRHRWAVEPVLLVLSAAGGGFLAQVIAQGRRLGVPYQASAP